MSMALLGSASVAMVTWSGAQASAAQAWRARSKISEQQDRSYLCHLTNGKQSSKVKFQENVVCAWLCMKCKAQNMMKSKYSFSL
jgi:hypothetical protein